MCEAHTSQSLKFHPKTKMSVNRTALFNAMNASIKAVRQYKLTDPDRALDEIEKLGILHEVLTSVTNFEKQLLNELDVD